MSKLWYRGSVFENKNTRKGTDGEMAEGLVRTEVYYLGFQTSRANVRSPIMKDVVFLWYTSPVEGRMVYRIIASCKTGATTREPAPCLWRALLEIAVVVVSR